MTVPLWQYAVSVAGLAMFYGLLSMRQLKQIRDLKGALEVKQELLGDPRRHIMDAAFAGQAAQVQHMAACDTLTIQGDDFEVQIEVTQPTQLSVKTLKIV